MSSLCKKSSMAQLKKTTIAITNKVPPSPRTSTPSTVKWLAIAPNITPNPIMAPSHVVRGIRRSTEEINSATPDKYLPKGSMPIVSNIYMDSGDPVNLKNRVCSIIPAAIIRKSQIKIFIVDLVTLTITRLYNYRFFNSSQLGNIFKPIKFTQIS